MPHRCWAEQLNRWCSLPFVFFFLSLLANKLSQTTQHYENDDSLFSIWEAKQKKITNKNNKTNLWCSIGWLFLCTHTIFSTTKWKLSCYWNIIAVLWVYFSAQVFRFSLCVSDFCCCCCLLHFRYDIIQNDWNEFPIVLIAEGRIIVYKCLEIGKLELFNIEFLRCKYCCCCRSEDSLTKQLRCEKFWLLLILNKWQGDKIHIRFGINSIIAFLIEFKQFEMQSELFRVSCVLL